MARKLRIESRDGLYHVINRGNYRSFVFETEGAKLSFEKTLFEACQRFGWCLSAYAIMGNHYHLALHTPQGNLIAGMRWLQGTYGMRFNRYRKEHGHVWQGRYQSLIIEPGESLQRVIDYIHLNPVRANFVKLAHLPEYRWTSLYYYFKKRERPECFLPMELLEGSDCGEKDTLWAWRRYFKTLELKNAVDAKTRDQLEHELTRGWCIGSLDYKKKQAKMLMNGKTALHFEAKALKELNELQWEAIVLSCLKALRQDEASIADSKKSVDWKLAIGCFLKTNTAVSNSWLSQRLNMGAPKAVSNNLGVYARKKKTDCSYFPLLEKRVKIAIA